MNKLERFNIGIVGACGRGSSFKSACDAMHNVGILAVCDRNEDGLSEAAENLGATEKYTDYDAMLGNSNLDAVIVATPMHFHAPQAIQALQAGLHVLSEVTAAVSLEECHALVAAANASHGVYMMAENYTYTQSNAIVREMVRRGEFGTTYYADGEYIHELKGLNETTTWRRKWQNGIDGITYGTHSLGPILQWMPNDRVVEVSCGGSGHHYQDPRGENYAQDTSVMLCKMQSGGLVKIRVDMISDRPHAMTNYQLQGTNGCYESSRGWGDKNKIWLRSRCDEHEWRDLMEFEEEFMPEMWRKSGDAAAKAGHGGGDYFEIVDFVEAAQGVRPPDIGIHQAMDMTLPGLISQNAIATKTWEPVPDSREW